MNSLINFRTQKQFENILDLLSTALPESVEVQEELDALITKKSSYIKKLKKQWAARKIPIYNEKTSVNSISNFKVTR